MEYKMLKSPMKIGNVEIKNRVVLPPMLMGFGQFDGIPTEKMMDYYEERAKGGAGLIMTEITRVNDKTGSSAFAQLAVSHDYHIAPLAEMAKRIQRHGAKFFVQLHHPGRQNVGLLVGTVPLSIEAEKLTKGAYGKLLYKLTPAVGPILLKHDIVPSSVAPSKCEPAYFAGGRVRGLTHKEILELEQQFIDGAIRVFKAGCDGVELHCAHGYLLQQFLSPVTNQRTDEYGGSLENRMRFILNIIKGIKTECGKNFPVIVRLSVDECYSMIGQEGKGYDLKTGIEVAKRLEKAGVDAIDVSSAGYDTFNYWLEPVSFEPGWRKYMAKAIKEAVSIPVLAANLIRSPEQAEQQLEEGVQDFVCLGRSQIADPYWTEKALNGKTIRRCICCLNCFQTMQENAYIGSHGECSVNPFVGHEKEKLVKNGNGLKVLVAGAGSAGLTAADILARRGFDVTVFEKSDKPGGQLNLACVPPKKDKTAWFTEDAYKICLEDGVKFVFNKALDAETAKEENAYAVISATGSNPIKPNFGGSHNDDSIFTFEDILSKKVKLENCNVAVIGSGLTGLETAEYLTSNGCKVTIVEMASELAPGTWMQHKDDILPKLEKAGTVFKTSEKLCEIEKDCIVTENTKTKARSRIKCDKVVLSLGSRPDKTLEESLKNTNIRVFAVGDCTKAGNIAAATKKAYIAATTL